MNKLHIVLCAAALAAGASVALAQDTAVAPAPAPAAAQPTLLSNNVDTWIEGTVLSLDANAQKFSVRGVKLPYATAEAGMMADIANKTKDITDPAQRQAKIDEVRASWANKLNKSKAEKIADSPSTFKFSLPDKANLVIMSEPPMSSQATPNQEIAIKSASSSSSSASILSNDTVSKTAQASATVSDPRLANNVSQKELSALHSLKDLKIGDKVKVGYEGGLLSNTAYVVLEGAPVAR